jgi:hypothetical protein
MDATPPKKEPAADHEANQGASPSGTAGTSEQHHDEEEDLEFGNFFSTRKPKDFKAGLSSGMKSIGVNSSNHPITRMISSCVRPYGAKCRIFRASCVTLHS